MAMDRVEQRLRRVTRALDAANVAYAVIGLPALIRMKLTSFRDVDRVHLADLLATGLIDAAVLAALPVELRDRLEEVRGSMDVEDER